MVFKLRKVFFNAFFWVGLFAAIVIFNTIWALTH